MSDPTPTEKRCTKCGEIKPSEAFNKNKNRSDGLHAHCKLCRAAYYDANADTLRAYSRAYYTKNTETSRQSCRTWYAANRLAKRAYDLAYRATHRYERRAYKRAYYNANVEAMRAASAARRLANPDVFLTAIERRRARKKDAGGDFSPQELKAMRKAQNGICAYCQFHYEEPLQIDHVIPIAQGGPHQASNIVLACPVCNMNKGNRIPEQWTDRWYLRKPKEDQGTEE